MISGKTMLVTGGTGSFGHTVVERCLQAAVKEIRIHPGGADRARAPSRRADRARPDPLHSYVSQAALLSAMGRMEASQLSRAVPLYDPVKHFKRVRSAGALPYEPVIAALDRGLGYPTQKGRPIPAPAPATVPIALEAATNPAPPPGSYATSAPVAPLPGTEARNTPQRLDSTPDPNAAVPTARP